MVHVPWLKPEVKHATVECDNCAATGIYPVADGGRKDVARPCQKCQGKGCVTLRSNKGGR